MGRCQYPALVALLFASAIAGAARAQAPKECLASYEAAQRERLKHDLESAKRELLVCQKPECPEVLRRDCTAWLAELERTEPSIVIVTRAGDKIVTDATIALDGKILPTDASGPIRVAAGKHRLEVESIDYDPVSLDIIVEPGKQSQRVDVELSAPVAPEPVSAKRDLTLVYGLAAVGVIGIGSFTFFGLRSHSRKNDLDECKGHCAQDDVDSVKRDQIVADISLGVGVVCLGAATYLFLQQPKRKESVRIGIGPRNSGVQALVEGAF
jgi:hypothetical protein